LQNVDLSVERGSVVVVCGPSGSGKSTMLRCINGLETFESGSMRVLGCQLDRKAPPSGEFRARIGMVFQKFSLYPHMDVAQNVTLALRKVLRMRQPEAIERAQQMLERVGLPDKLHARPTELSGGQQQRVAIARALVMEPKIMLFDEPTSALDAEIIREVLDVILSLAGEGMTMLVVTHEMGFAREAADRVVFMDQGAILENTESNRFFAAPSTDRGRRFMEKILRH
jgi:ABC-type polar amino acid transport system ATPase subunit